MIKFLPIQICVFLTISSRSISGLIEPFIKPSPSSSLPGGLCSLTGIYVDNNGDEASITQNGDFTLDVISLSTGTGWTKADGFYDAVDLNGWVNFGASNNLTFTSQAACNTMSFSNGETWTKSQPVENITTVHIVFMTHLDIGFTLLARDVCEEYFDKHFPNGINLSKELRALGGPAQYSVTTHPWLVQEFLDGASQCARVPRTPDQIQLLEQAIADNDIRWHGKPMNNFVELEDAEWFATSLRMSAALNLQFNKSWGSVTCKSTDVPGLSKSAIPILAAAGKKAIHLGYNSACRVPNIPQAFLWTHAESNTQLLTFVNNNYGSEIRVPGSTHALVFHYSMDNSGPPQSVSEVVNFWNATQLRYPNAQLLLSSLDDFALAILPIAETLPQVTGEIGQSWSYGAPADPGKLAAFRAARRVRNNAVSEGWLDALDPDLYNYERRLWVGGPEHNFGLCFGCYLPGGRSTNGNWSNDEFHPLRFADSRYVFIESGNLEKRNFTVPLPPSSSSSPGFLRYLDALVDEADALIAKVPDLSDYVIVDPSKSFENCGRFSSITFNSTDGSISSLVDGLTSFQWVESGSQGLSSFHYRTYTEDDFNTFNREYNPGCGPPCGDFAKQGMDSANPESKSWFPTLDTLYQKQNGASNGCEFIASITLPQETVIKYGGMSSIFILYAVDTDPTLPAPSVGVELRWFNKTSTRLAESAWMSFVPRLSNTGDADLSLWKMDVLGSGVSPLEVVDMGTRHVHAVWEGVYYDNVESGGPLVTITALDTPLVSPGDAEHLIFYDGMTQPDMKGGWHFDVFSNLWGTAFAQWSIDASGIARWTLSLQAS